MAIVGRNQSVEQLVHDLDLHVRFVEHAGAVYLLELLVPLVVSLLDGPRLRQLALDYRVRLLHGLVEPGGNARKLLER